MAIFSPFCFKPSRVLTVVSGIKAFLISGPDCGACGAFSTF
jgi:hypothetical protein